MPMDLRGTGLTLLGHCPLEPADKLPHAGGTLLLLGPDEPEFWPVFAASPEYADGLPDPLDRWSTRVIDALAKPAGGVPYYPFGDAPYHPFYTWALRSGQAWPSPIAFLVHADRGLFVSYRAAVWMPKTMPVIAAPKPCDTCAAPCATACPVDAFADGYAVDACRSYLYTPDGADCVTQGCAARRACPVGAGRRLSAQSAFHMEAFQ